MKKLLGKGHINLRTHSPKFLGANQIQLLRYDLPNGTTTYSPPARGYNLDVEFLTPALLAQRTPMFRDVNSTGFSRLLMPNQSSKAPWRWHSFDYNMSSLKMEYLFHNQ